MHSDEFKIDVSLVARLIESQFPAWASLPIEPVTSTGTDNAMYRLGDDMAVRLPRIPSAVRQVDLEWSWLPRLAPLLPVAIPSPLGRGRPAEGYLWPWSVYSWLEGGNPNHDRLSEPGLLVADLAGFVAALHRIDPTGGPAAARGVPLAMQDRSTRAAIEELHGVIDTDAATAAWEAALEVPEWHGSPVWIHGDISPGNVLLAHGRLAAVIDFGCLGVGDPACDLIVAWNLLPEHARTAFRAGTGVDAATWARGRGWALSVALLQLPYYRDTNPGLAANALHVIHEICRS
jgi:aminoglycoside phosphotransferase (APT) family kinase protein